MDEQLKRLSRRHFLSGAAIAAGTAILAACGGSSSATDTPKPASGSTGSATAAAPTAASSATSATRAPSAASVTSATSAPTTAASSAPAPAATATGGKTVASQIDTAGIKKGGHLTEAATSDIQTFNPVLSHDTTSNLVINLISEPLVSTDPDTLEPTPLLATKWDVSPDGKVYTFTLKPGVKWHDGEPFTADDVKFTYDLLMDSKSGTTHATTLNDHIASVTVKDPQAVVFALKDVIAPFLSDDATYGIVPKHILGSVKPEEIPTHPFSASKPVGSGPFMLSEYKQGDHVTLGAFPNYHRGAPALDQYVFKVVKDTNVTLQQLKTSEVDIATVQATLYDDAKKQTNFDTIPYDNFSYSILVFNLDPTKTTLFQDVKVRQALCYALNRQGIVDRVRGGLSTVGVGVEPIRSWAYQPDKIPLKYPFDVTKANQLLDDAGWVKGKDGIRAKDGKRFSFTMRTYTDVTANAYMAVFQENWKDIGVEMTPQSEDFNIFVSRLAKAHDFEMFWEGFSFGVDPDIETRFSSTQFPSGLNYGAYKNPQVDTALDQALHVLDRAKRTDLYVQAQVQIAMDCPVLVTDFPKTIVGVNKRVKNYIPTGLSGANRYAAYQWYVTDGK
ncbi:MAG: ABC transporter substrate-binding protein [Thermomicrobiales bacterium]